MCSPHRRARGALAGEPLTGSVAAISVGVVDGVPMTDLAYAEDSRADVDMNIVCTGDGDFVEVQGTGEGAAFGRETLGALLDLGQAGCARLSGLQSRALADPEGRAAL